MKEKYYICEQCENLISVIRSCGQTLSCCGHPMKELIPCSTDAAEEKHLPVYERDGNTVSVTVGSTEHPMEPEHSIEWIALHTKDGVQRKTLKPGEPPKACFALCEDDKIEAVYAYCNLHSLWEAH